MTFVPNRAQREAIEHIHGPMVVIAGAGTGKTRVLVERVGRLIETGVAKPDEILAVTYTDKAAAELVERVTKRLGKTDLRACTFHALCLGILKSNRQDFRLLEDKDLWILLRRKLESLGLNYYVKAVQLAEFLHTLLDFFSRCQDELVDAARFQRFVEEIRAGKHAPPRVTKSKKCAEITPDEHLSRCEEIAHVFTRVEEMLRKDNLGTFGDMITGAVRLLQSDARVLRAEQQRSRFLLIDEFQDANLAHIELIRLLAGEAQNVFVVGDPDQAIFRFRGASSAAFEEFLRLFPLASAVVLEENQRSTSTILNCAFAVINRNPVVECPLTDGRRYVRQALRSAREQRAAEQRKPLTPETVQIVLNYGKEEEAGDIAEAIAERWRSDDRGSIAVLYRQNSHRDEICQALAERRIPFVVKGLNVFETAVIRDLLACLSAVAKLDSESLFRIAALPTFDVNGDALRSALASAKREASFVSLLKQVPGGARVVAAVEKARKHAASVDWNAALVCDHVLRGFGFFEFDEEVKVFRRFLDRWHEKPITETGSLTEFMEYVEMFHEAGGVLESSVPDNPDAVQLMTVHSAKGLEFDSVFLLRASSPSFPRNYQEPLFEFPQALRAMPRTDDGSQIQREEERRLFYVALTRARDSLSVYARPGKGGTPAGFLRDLMPSDIAKDCWTQREARPFRAQLAAGGSPASGVSAWMLMKPRPELLARALSATAIDTYDTCPLKYKLSYDWKIPGPASASLIYGSVVHEVLRDVHQAILAGRPRTEAEVLQRFHESLAEQHIDEVYQRDLLEKQGIKQLSAYIRTLNSSLLPPVLHAERTFEMKVEGVRLRGRMDRVDRTSEGRFRVIDFKTGAAFDQQKADKSLQLSIYDIAARETLDARQPELVIYSLESNSEVVTTRDEAALAKTRKKIVEVSEGIAARSFDPNPGYHCRSCDFRSLCPATEQKLYMISSAVGSG